MIDTIPTTVRIRRRCRVQGARGRFAAGAVRDDAEDAEEVEDGEAEASVSDASVFTGVGLVTGAP